jgi:hypothetical protein
MAAIIGLADRLRLLNGIIDRRHGSRPRRKSRLRSRDRHRGISGRHRWI